MTLGGRALMTVVAALVLSGFVAVGTASAATVGVAWQARVGSGGANGTSTVSIVTSGPGTISVNLKGLAQSASYSETLFRGTCSRPAVRIASLPPLKTTAAGKVARTNPLTAAQASQVNGGGTVIRLASGGRVLCGAFIRQGSATLVTTCDQGHLASAVANGGTVRFACDATITLTSTIPVVKPVVLDGSDRNVAIDGGGAVGLFSLGPGAAFRVVGLTLQDGGSGGAGGAIDATRGGSVTVVASTFARNRAATGGAIAAAGDATVTVDSSTFVDDLATGAGGAIDGPTVTVTDSTFVRDTAGTGGAIHATGSLTLVNGTFVDNAGTGAALALDGGTATVRDSIMAGAAVAQCALGAAAMSDQGGDFSTDASCGFTQGTSHAGVALATLGLAPLAGNGGPTQTVALMPGSAAIDAGVACPPPATDQRGMPRPQGAACDAGAYEVEPPPGYDISFPQCGRPFPDSPAFGIVGVNGGRAFTVNPCLGAGSVPSELTWAGGAGAALYANTGNPGPALSAHWPSGQTTPRACDAAAAPGADTVDCAYDYGWNAAADSYQAAVAAYVSLGLAPQGATQTPAPNAWWLDVETTNSWRSDVSLNVAALQGEVDYLRSVGATSVGFYSTAYQWRIITGGTDVFAAYPSWLAGAASSIQARAACVGPGFTGGSVRLVQYPSSGFDADASC